MSRDRAYEDEFLSDVDRLAAMQAGAGHQPIDHFIRLVRERLDLGDRLYGDRFLTSDNMREALDEPCDAVTWSLLELQRQRLAGADAELVAEARMEIIGAAVLAARADQGLRRAQRLLDGTA